MSKEILLEIEARRDEINASIKEIFKLGPSADNQLLISGLMKQVVILNAEWASTFKQMTQ